MVMFSETLISSRPNSPRPPERCRPQLPIEKWGVIVSAFDVEIHRAAAKEISELKGKGYLEIEVFNQYSFSDGNEMSVKDKHLLLVVIGGIAQMILALFGEQLGPREQNMKPA